MGKPIMIKRHNNPKLPHPPPNLDGSQLLDHKIIDESYVISTRVRTGRSISGFPLPPSISAQQRKELEGIVVKALGGLEGSLKGDYYPLAGSTTYAPKPNGIDKETEQRLVSEHFLFQEPDEPMLLSWRMERDWPHARGIYHNEAKTALVWVNEEDHLRVISMQKGSNIREVFDRFGALVKAVENACVSVGRRLEVDEMYGNILSCPSNCGTGLRASMMIKIPLASKQPHFKAWLAERHLQARGSGGFASAAADDGIRDVSNVDRMGKDEVTLVNEMVQGVADLIEWEKQLEKLEKFKVNPLPLMAKMPQGHDLSLKEEHETYMQCADELYNALSLEELREMEEIVSGQITHSWNYSTLFHIALKNAISKKLMKDFPALHATVVFALYHENNRMVRKGDPVPGESHPNGEDFIRRKHKQMTWLFQERADCTWTMLGVDDGCDRDSAGLMEKIIKEEGFQNCTVARLNEVVKAESCPVLNYETLKKDWNPDDLLVKASQKAGAILLSMDLAAKEDAGGKKHVIVYTDSDLSTDLCLCGLNFKTLFDGANCSVSQRFGQPYAVNCGKLLAAGGIAPGMPRASMVQLSLRHKLRMNLLPPLAPIIDTNCGHKAIFADAAQETLNKVRDYKGSFDMDWLMSVGICGKHAGNPAPINVTAIPWVNSVAESNFWGGGGAAVEDPVAAKLKSMESWFKIFGAMTTMHGWHSDSLKAAGLLTGESEAYVEWVSGLDVHAYMRLSDAILAMLEGKAVTMPEPTIMNMDLDTLKKLSSA